MVSGMGLAATLTLGVLLAIGPVEADAEVGYPAFEQSWLKGVTGDGRGRVWVLGTELQTLARGWTGPHPHGDLPVPARHLCSIRAGDEVLFAVASYVGEVALGRASDPVWTTVSEGIDERVIDIAWLDAEELIVATYDALYSYVRGVPSRRPLPPELGGVVDLIEGETPDGRPALYLFGINAIGRLDSEGLSVLDSPFERAYGGRGWYSRAEQRLYLSRELDEVARVDPRGVEPPTLQTLPIPDSGTELMIGYEAEVPVVFIAGRTHAAWLIGGEVQRLDTRDNFSEGWIDLGARELHVVGDDGWSILPLPVEPREPPRLPDSWPEPEPPPKLGPYTEAWPQLHVGLGAGVHFGEPAQVSFIVNVAAGARIFVGDSDVMAVIQPMVGYSHDTLPELHGHRLVVSSGFGFNAEFHSLLVEPGFVYAADEGLGVRTTLRGDTLYGALSVNLAHQVLWSDARTNHVLQITLGVDLAVIGAGLGLFGMWMGLL